MGHEHKPDWSTLRPASGVPGVADVWCSCGLSGSVRIEPEDVQWGEED